ncbi:uncharacterized protein LOC131432698 [Malaya genurostris]|uniref:uncharacterized protein LOC131432698 n=1 Tax=Malaya genurostris TaxID=325434 RepID=UPI0026F3AFA0|nr:uncharacterized protein LOC131432698 [Malaya genurostris]
MEDEHDYTPPKARKVTITLPKGITLKNLPRKKDKSPSDSIEMVEIQTGNGLKAIKRKVPIIRQPGELIVPKQFKSSETVTVSQSPSFDFPLIKKEWTRVPPPGVKTALKEDRSAELSPETEEFDDETSQECDQSESSNERLDRIEKKLDRMLSILNHHDSVLKGLKWNMKDLRLEIQNMPKASTEEVYITDRDPVPVLRSNKRTIFFPIADDAYLLRLDELAQADEDTRDELTSLYDEAPSTSLYEYLRKNIGQLFQNTSRYTWTGRPSNATPMGPLSNAAHKLNIIDLLILTARDKFYNASRDLIEREFKRALTNFNDTKYSKQKRRMEQKLQE